MFQRSFWSQFTLSELISRTGKLRWRAGDMQNDQVIAEIF